jgi:hypothetical protein
MLYGRRRKILKKVTVGMGCGIGECESAAKRYKKFVLDTVFGLVGEVERRRRKTWITQKMINKG